MGWSYSCDPNFKKADQVAELRKGWSEGYALVADQVVGNHYWAALRVPDGQVTIILALMQSGGRDSGWGYKSMSESMGPRYYDCPLSLLDLATSPPPDVYAAGWREMVRKHHARKALRPKPEPGMHIVYGGEAYLLLEPAGPRRGWFVQRCRDKLSFRMMARQVSGGA